MIRVKKEEFTTVLNVNPQQIMPIDRYFFLYPNLKLIDEGVKPKELPIMEFYKQRRKNWRGGITNLTRTKNIVAIYKDLKTRGYNIYGKRKPIRVVVEKGGIISCYDGHNRLCMLHHLGVTKPIQVKAYLEPEIKELIKIKKQRGPKGFYQPIQHPIFQKTPLSRGSPVERLKYLTLCLRADTFDSILDIGCYTGYHSVNLARQFNCKATGVEMTDECHAISVGLKDWWKRYYGDVTFRHGDFRELPLKKHDVTICLSVLHHYLKQSPAAVINFVNRIERLTRKFAIIEVAGNVPQMRKVKPTPTAAVWRKILNRTNFCKVTHLKGSPGTRHWFELRRRV